MAAYQTGSAPNAAALLDAVKGFAEAQGWTTNQYATDGTGGKRLHIQKGAVYANFRCHTGGADYPDPSTTAHESATSAHVLNGILVNVSTGYSAAQAWYRQPGSPYTTRYFTHGVAKLTGSIPAYHLFSTGNCLYLFVEFAAGKYQWIVLGELDKIGAYAGGQFCSASSGFGSIYDARVDAGAYFQGSGLFSNLHNGPYACGLINVTADGEAGWKWSRDLTPYRPAPARHVFDSGVVDQGLLHQSPNALSSLAVLLPIQTFVFRDAANSPTLSSFSPLGYVPGLFFVSMESFVPGQEISFGSDTYRVFPFVFKASSKADATTWGWTHGSGYFGLAARSN